MYQAYDYDGGHIEEYVEGTSTPEKLKAYLDRYVYGVKDHWGYREQVGGLERLNSLRADPDRGY